MLPEELIHFHAERLFSLGENPQRCHTQALISKRIAPERAHQAPTTFAAMSNKSRVARCFRKMIG
jgi:hypothetical protein